LAERVYDKYKVPKGYIAGLGRDYPHPPLAHLYQGTFGDVEGPMCRYAANRDDGESFSIWRGNVGKKGICKTCMKRALAGLDHIWEKEDDDAKNTIEDSGDTGLPTDNKRRR